MSRNNGVRTNHVMKHEEVAQFSDSEALLLFKTFSEKKKISYQKVKQIVTHKESTENISAAAKAG